MSLLEFFGMLFLVELSFLFHVVVYEDRLVNNFFWKVVIGGAILAAIFLAALGY